MKVITLNKDRLDESCRNLASLIEKSGFKPDLVLGIKTGGDLLAKDLIKFIKPTDFKYETCQIIRKSTKRKKSILRNYINLLPVFILNLLRIIEYILFFNKKMRNDFVEVILPDNLNNFNRILLVDDACDSGVTLQFLKNRIIEAASSSEIKTAVLTVTTKSPVIYPDYYLYNKRILIRFPWSIDAK